MTFNYLKLILIPVICVSICTISCKLADPESLTINDIIVVESESDSVNANGVDSVRIFATLQGETKDGLDITFKTDSGFFSSIHNGDSNKRQIIIKATVKQAEVFLISSIEVKDAMISASVNNYTVFKKIKFTRVYPERIYLSSNVLCAKADGRSTVTLKAALIPKDNRGTVSKDTRVHFNVTDTKTGAFVPQLYRESLSDTNGIATAQFVSNQIGLFKIECSIEGKPDLTESIILKFIE